MGQNGLPVGPTVPIAGSINAAKWRVQIFPQLEQVCDATLVQLNNATLTDIYNTNSPLRTTILPVWKCPSSPMPDTQPASWVTWWTNYNHQVPSYKGIMGAYTEPDGRTRARSTPRITAAGGRTPACCYGNEKIRIADCTDGTSNTIIVGEQSGKVPLASGKRSDPRNGDHSPGQYHEHIDERRCHLRHWRMRRLVGRWPDVQCLRH